MNLSETIRNIIREGKIITFQRDNILNVIDFVIDFVIEIKHENPSFIGTKKVAEKILIDQCISGNYRDELLNRSLNRLNEQLNNII